MAEERGEPPDLDSVVASIPGVLYSFLLRADGTSCFPYISDQCEELFEVSAAELNADAQAAMVRILPEDLPSFEAEVVGSMSAMRLFSWAGRFVNSRGEHRLIRAESKPYVHPEGVIWHGLIFDARDELAMQRELVRAQGEVQALSVPIIEVWEQVVTVPLSGSYEEDRAQRLTQALLEKVSGASIRVVILDLTGIVDVDTATVGHLLQIMNALSLLGAECALSGISPVVAQTMVTLDVASDQLRYFRALHQALRWAIAHLEGAA